MKKFCLSFILLSLFFISYGCGCNKETKDDNTPVEETYTIMFDGSEGTLVSGKKIQKVSKPSDIVAPVYEREGYTFKGFNKDLSSLNSDNLVNAVQPDNDSYGVRPVIALQ